MCSQKEEEIDRVGRPNTVKSETDFSTATSPIKLLYSTGGPRSEPTERRTTAGPGDVDSVFVTSMLSAHTLSKLTDSVFPDVELLIDIITVLSELFTFTLSQISLQTLILLRQPLL